MKKGMKLVPDLIPYVDCTVVFDITGLACYRELKNMDRLNRSLGILGGGNHFIGATRF